MLQQTEVCIQIYKSCFHLLIMFIEHYSSRVYRGFHWGFALWSLRCEYLVVWFGFHSGNWAYSCHWGPSVSGKMPLRLLASEILTMCSLYFKSRICEYGLETVMESEMSVNTTSCVSCMVCQCKLLLMWNAAVYRVAQWLFTSCRSRAQIKPCINTSVKHGVNSNLVCTLAVCIFLFGVASLKRSMD